MVSGLHLDSKGQQLNGLSVAILTLVVSAVILVMGIVVISSTNTPAIVGSSGTSNQSNSETELLANGTSGTLSSTPDALNSVTVSNDTYVSFIGNDPLNNPSTTVQFIELGKLGTDMKDIFCCNFSVSFWMNQRRPDDNLDVTFFGTKSLDDSGKGIVLYENSGVGTQLSLQANNGSVTFNLVNQTAKNLNNWTHVVVTYNGSAILMYTNATIKSFPSNANLNLTNGFVNGTAAMWFVKTNTQSIFYDALNGSIDEIRIYNRTLIQSEITNIFLSGRIPNASLPTGNLVAWYSMNENSGSTLFDSARNFGINATLNNTPTYVTDSTVSLTGATNFTQSGTTFTLVNPRYSWALLTVNYNTTATSAGGEISSDINSTVTGLGSFADFFVIIVLAIVITIVISLLLTTFAGRRVR